MQNWKLHRSPVRQGIALGMALVVAFLGIAVFSSLHKHQGAKNRCSLNGFDQLMTGEAEAPHTVLTAGSLEWSEPQQKRVTRPQFLETELFLRGPPAAA